MADKEMKTAVLEALKESETRTLSIKQLRKIVIGTPFSENASKAIWIWSHVFYNFFTGKNKDLKTKFMSLLDEMCLGKKISIDGDNVTKVSKGEKRGREEGQGTDTASSSRPDTHSFLILQKLPFHLLIFIISTSLAAPFPKGSRDEHGNVKKTKGENVNKYMPTVARVEDLKFDINELWKNGEQVYR
jgi:hypothetical protein